MRSFRDGFERPTINKIKENPILRSFKDGFARPIIKRKQDTPNRIANLIYWLDANRITGLNDGDRVSTWINAVGNGYDPAQGTTAAKPYYIASDPDFNDYPSLDFQGAQYLSYSGIELTQPNTAFCVFNISTSGANYCFDSTNSSYRNRIVREADNNMYVHAGTGLSGYSAPSPVAAAIVTGIFNGTNSQIYKNYEIKATGNAGTESMSGIRVGANAAAATFLTGKIAEIIIYDALLSGIEIGRVNRYLRDKYKITLAA
jgi:hypothetical protein